LAAHFNLKAIISPTYIEEREYMTHLTYASAVDSLIHEMVCTRLDLSQVVSITSRYMHDPRKSYWKAVK